MASTEKLMLHSAVPIVLMSVLPKSETAVITNPGRHGKKQRAMPAMSQSSATSESDESNRWALMLSAARRMSQPAHRATATNGTASSEGPTGK